MNIKDEMKDLIAYLNYHTELYDAGRPQISDKEWDDKYFQLQHMEQYSGIVLPMSPTQGIHYEKVSELKKVKHSHPMLSLAKTKSKDEIKSFIGDKDWIAMLKMDGLTCSLTYSYGKLVKAETRGDGIEGEDILHNALVISSIPNMIETTTEEELIIDGEIICKTNDFEEFANDYKNPRNFAAGSIRLLDSSECATRRLTFIAWDCITPIAYTLSEKLSLLGNLGFTIVPYFYDNNTTYLDEQYENMELVAKDASYPIDGIVFKYNDCEYYDSLGKTDHHFRGGIAYKFADETVKTKLIDIEWSLGRSGILTPVAIFEPVELEGTEVSRASLHNVSVMTDLSGDLEKIGDTLEIFKANQIIPQVLSWEHTGTVVLKIPSKCPVCGGDTILKNNDGIETLWCDNKNCDGKITKKIEHYCSKGRMEVKGLSEKTIEKLIDWGWLNSISDLYMLSGYRDEWTKKEGFGPKSVDNILKAIDESAENVDLACFIAALGIPLIGRTVAKELVKHIDDWYDFIDKINNYYDFTSIDGFGEEMCKALWDFDYSEACDIVEYYIDFSAAVTTEESSQSLEGVTVVMTGKLKQFKNRDEFKSQIEAHGGKVASAVSSKTNYLITNDTSTGTAKNKKAAELGVEIITEGDFISKYF